MKEIYDLENKYGLMLFRMGLTHLTDVGVRHMDDESAENSIKQIIAKGEEDKDSGVTSIMTPEFQCNIIHCAAELAKFSIWELFEYIKHHVYVANSQGEEKFIMFDNKKCRCPLCEQQFIPDNGITPDEHLARGIIKVYREMQDFPHNRELPCPRCGHMRMKPELEDNAVSRFIDVYICDECGADEAVRDTKKNVFPLIAWSAVDDLLKCIPGVKCENYIPEKGNPYPLCNNPACEESTRCNISMHMEDGGGYE